MAGRHLHRSAKIIGGRILQTPCAGGGPPGGGLTRLLRPEPLRPNGPPLAFQGAIFRSLFLKTRGGGGGGGGNEFPPENFPQSQFHGRSTTGSSGDCNLLEKKTFRYWPTWWLKAFIGRMQSLEVEEVLSRVKTRKRRKELYVAATSFVHHRRMVQNTSRRHQKNGDKPPSVLEAGVKYNVIRVDSDGSLRHLEIKSSQLGVHPRDVDLLSSSTFIPQRATIAVQRDKVVVRMENVKAIVYKDHVLLFDAYHPRIMKEGVYVSSGRFKENSSHQRARDAFALSLAKQATERPCSLLDPMPFHLRAMEFLLEETSKFFHQKVDRLKLVVERILKELTHDVSMGGLQTLLPLKQAVVEVEHDVRDAHQAMDQVLCSDEIIQALCLVNDKGSSSPAAGATPAAEGEQQREDKCQGWINNVTEEEYLSKLRQATVDMLVTYQREVDDAGGLLEELRKGMEAAQEIWELGLDTTRNRIIRMNLYITIFTSSLAVATLPAAFFGMNLSHGYEEHPTMFYWVVGVASIAPLLMMGCLALAFQVYPRIVDKRRAEDLTGLLNLLRHLNSVDDIVEDITREAQSRRITRKEFQEILRSHNLAQFMRQKELDLIFRMFDSNLDGVLEREEMNSVYSGTQSRPSSPK